MYGGKIDSTGNVTNELRVFHIHNESWVLLSPKAKEQYAVVGHSAHIVTLKTGRVVMLIIFGHCPLYGYISNVQEYDLGTYIFFSESFLNVRFKILLLLLWLFNKIQPNIDPVLDLEIQLALMNCQWSLDYWCCYVVYMCYCQFGKEPKMALNAMSVENK